MPPMASERTRSTSPNVSLIRLASAAHRRSARDGSSNTRIFWRKTGERSPEERMKWPSSKAPAARNSARTSSRSEEHTSELQSLAYLVCRLLLEKKKKIHKPPQPPDHAS